MTAPSLLDELEGVVRLMDAASFVDLDWGWRRDDDDTPGSIFTHSFGGMHQAVAMCPRYGKDNFASDANYIIAMHNFIRARHAEIADMAKRLEAAERDAARWRMARNNTGNGLRLVRWNHDACEELQVMFPSPVLCDSDADAAIDAATQEGEE